MTKCVTRGAVLGLLFAGCGATAAASASMEDEATFLARCKAEGARDCSARWERAGNAAPIADALLALAPKADGAMTTDGRAAPSAVQRSSASSSLSFRWQARGAEGRYDLIQALRIRGVALETLGCPTFPMASMGREKVMRARAEGRAPFVLTIYSRAAPTGTEYGVHEVDADFSGAVPDAAALAAGRYPGGGGRAFAGEPTGWTATCPDPGK